MSNEEMYRIIEGMLFVSNDPVNIKGIATALEKTVDEAKQIMDDLIKMYEEDETRGIKIIKFDNKFQLVTKQNIFGYLTKANAELEKPRISASMLETLAIIAYKQPITKLEIENIRGVKSDYIVNKLLEYELICEVGRADKIGRPILFGTSDKFLMYFGLQNLEDLPEVAEQRQITNDNIDQELIRLKEQGEKEPSEEISMAITAAEELAKELKENPPKKEESQEENADENSSEEKVDGENVTEENNSEDKEENVETKEINNENTEEVIEDVNLDEETSNEQNENEDDEEEKEFDVDNIDWDSYTEEDDEDDDDWYDDDDDDDDWDEDEDIEDEGEDE